MAVPLEKEIGVVALAYQGISYTTTERVVDIGPLKVEATKEKTIPLPPVLGGVAVAGAAQHPAVEAVEGTDAALRRAVAVWGSGLVVAKAAKASQDLRFDRPAIGPATLRETCWPKSLSVVACPI